MHSDGDMSLLLDVRDLHIWFGATEAVRGIDFLKQLQQQYGMAMLFISHDLAVVGQVASRVAVMRSGLVVETGRVRNC
jgi:ABC-type dipeptide/oligopeptide/nickel transport system ATPase component